MDNNKKPKIITIGDLENVFEELLKTKQVLGYKDTDMYGYIKIYFLKGKKHYIEINEKTAHESVK